MHVLNGMIWCHQTEFLLSRLNRVFCFAAQKLIVILACIGCVTDSVGTSCLEVFRREISTLHMFTLYGLLYISL